MAQWERRVLNKVEYTFVVEDPVNIGYCIGAAEALNRVHASLQQYQHVMMRRMSLVDCSESGHVTHDDLFQAAQVAYTPFSVRISMLEPGQLPQSDADFAVDEWTPIFLALILGDYAKLEDFLMFHCRCAKKLLVGRKCPSEEEGEGVPPRLLAVGDDVRFLLCNRDSGGADVPVDPELCPNVYVRCVTTALYPVLQLLVAELGLTKTLSADSPNSSTSVSIELDSQKVSLRSACRRVMHRVHNCQKHQLSSPMEDALVGGDVPPADSPTALVIDPLRNSSTRIDLIASPINSPITQASSTRPQFYIGFDELYSALDGSCYALLKVQQYLPIGPIINVSYAHARATVSSAAILPFAPQDGQKILFAETCCGSLSTQSALLQFPSHVFVNASPHDSSRTMQLRTHIALGNDVSTPHSGGGGFQSTISRSPYFFSVTLFHLSLIRKLISASVSIAEFGQAVSAATRRWNGSVSDGLDHSEPWWMPIALPCISAVAFSMHAINACLKEDPGPVPLMILEKVKVLLRSVEFREYLLCTPQSDKERFHELWYAGIVGSAADGVSGFGNTDIKKFNSRVELLHHIVIEQTTELAGDPNTADVLGGSAWLKMWHEFFTGMTQGADAIRGKLRMYYRTQHDPSHVTSFHSIMLQFLSEEDEDHEHSHFHHQENFDLSGTGSASELEAAMSASGVYSGMEGHELENVEVTTKDLDRIIKALRSISKDIAERIGDMSPAANAASPKRSKLSETSPLEDRFQDAQSAFAKAAGRFSNETKLLFYGLYKQATEGKVSSSRPWALDMAGRAKWDAWSSFSGVTKTEAMERYVEEWELLLRK